MRSLLVIVACFVVVVGTVPARTEVVKASTTLAQPTLSAASLAQQSPDHREAMPKDAQCPDGWSNAVHQVTVEATGDPNRHVYVDLYVDIPVTAEVMPISHGTKQPKFCWKDRAYFTFTCTHWDPTEGNWLRFSGWRIEPKPGDSSFRRYSIRFQNESHNRSRTAALVVCYKPR